MSWPLLPVMLALAAAPAADLLDLDAALAEAAAQSPALQEAEARVAQAEAAREAFAPLLPNPQIEGSFTSDALTGAEGELDVDVGVSQTLPFPGVRAARSEAADARLRAARALRDALRIELSSQLAVALADVAVAVEQRRLRAELQQAAARLSDAALRRAESGSGSQAEANLAQVELASADAALASADAEIARARAALCERLGRGDCGPFTAAWPDARPQPERSVEALVEEALAARRELEAALLALEAADREIAAAELSRIPSLQISAGYGYERASLDAPGGAVLRDEDHLLGLGLSIALPLWNQGSPAVAAARADKRAAEAAVGRARAAVAAEVRQAHARVLAARSADERWQGVLPRVDETLGWILAAYEAGGTAIEEYLTARDRLVRARLDALAAKRARTDAEYGLLRALGAPATRENEPGERR